MNSIEQATLQLHDTLKECFRQIRFARAAELARCSRYLEAEGLLAPNGRAPSDPKELDLLARISAQQRRYESARRLWEAALQQSPGNTDYERAIECAIDAEHLQTRLRKGAMIALLVFTVVALVAAMWTFLPRRPPKPTSQPFLQRVPATGVRERQPTPATPQPTPATPQPTPATPQPAPATPQPAPEPPQPAPEPPQPPATPQPAPATQPVPPLENQ